MEIQRLKPMVEGYDEKLFNELYQKTAGLRRKLSSEINPHRFGLAPEDIHSWFDDKFIYVFNKYYHKYNSEILLGYLINSLKLFKCRVLRAAYTTKYSQTIIQIEDYSPLSNLFKEDSFNRDKQEKLEEIILHLESILTADALFILKIMLNPPPYIMTRITPSKNQALRNRIPDELICKYLELPYNKKIQHIIAGLKNEIDAGINQTKEYFRSKELIAS